jgi:hypothetical protein
MPHLCRTLHQSFCPGHVHQTWKFWTPTTHATCISRAAFFKHKYLTNPSVTLEDQVIAAAARLTNALQGINQPQLNTSTLQALADLRDVFYKAANATNTPGKQVTNKEVKIWDQSPTKGIPNKEVKIWDQSLTKDRRKDRPNKEIEIWDHSPTKDRRVTFEPKFVITNIPIPLHA